jgi:hypothetical protein
MLNSSESPLNFRSLVLSDIAGDDLQLLRLLSTSAEEYFHVLFSRVKVALEQRDPSLFLSTSRVDSLTDLMTSMHEMSISNSVLRRLISHEILGGCGRRAGLQACCRTLLENDRNVTAHGNYTEFKNQYQKSNNEDRIFGPTFSMGVLAMDLIDDLVTGRTYPEALVNESTFADANFGSQQGRNEDVDSSEVNVTKNSPCWIEGVGVGKEWDKVKLGHDRIITS